MPRRSGRILIGCLAVALLTAGVASVLLSFRPYEEVRGHLDPMFGGSADRYDPAFHDRAMLGIRSLGVASAMAAIALVGLYRLMGERIRRFWEGLRVGVDRSWNDLRMAARVTPSAHLAALALIVFTGLAVRVWHLGQPIRYDEAKTYQYFASKPFYVAVAHYEYGGNSHLLNTVLANLSMTLFGDELWALRLPAFLAGMLLIPAAYALGRCFLGQLPALFCAALVAGWPVYVLYSTNARGYILVTLFLAAVVLLGARLVSNPGDGLAWGLWSLAAALGFYSHPGFVLFLPGVIVWMALQAALQARSDEQSSAPFLGRMALALAAAGVVTVVLYGPVLLVWGVESITAHKYVSPRSMDAVVSALPELVRSTWSLWYLGLPGVAGVVTLCAVALLFFRSRHRRREPSLARLLLCLFVAGAAVVLAGRFVIPGRAFVPLVLVALIAAVGGISVVVRGTGVSLSASVASRASPALAVTVALALCAGVIASGSVLEAPGGHGIEDLLVAEYLMETLEPGDRVVAFFPYGAPLYYYFRSQDADLRYLRFFEAAAADRVFLVEGTGTRLRLPDGFDADLFHPPRAVEQIGGTTIYRLDRRAG